MLFTIAAAIASPRAQRSAVLASLFHELTGFCLEADYVVGGGGGEVQMVNDGRCV
jgi:hypothetical protein